MGRPLTKKQQKQMKDRFVEALEKSLGVMTTAAQSIGIRRETICRWRRDDPDFDTKCQAATEIAIDFAESKLIQNIAAGDTQAIKFFLSTKGRHRGYTEKIGLEGEITVNRPRVIFEDEPDANQDQ